jgi:hypothetical protein
VFDEKIVENIESASMFCEESEGSCPRLSLPKKV